MIRHALLLALGLTAFFLCLAATPSVTVPQKQEKSVTSKIIKTAAGERVMIQDIWIDAPVKDVWAAFTTEEGWTSWSTPIAKIDFKVGGTIRTHYTEGAKIGDKGTITLHILNYVPERLLTIQAELQDNWPEVMQADHEHLMNVIVFETISEKRTHVISYGVGYGNAPIYDKLLKFFAPANEGLYRKMKKVLEAKVSTPKQK